MRAITALHIVRDGQPLTAIQSGLPNQNDWLTTAELLSIARQIHERAIDGQRIAAEPPRHPATPGYLEYPSFDESKDFDPVSWRRCWDLPLRPGRGGIDEVSMPAFMQPGEDHE